MVLFPLLTNDLDMEERLYAWFQSPVENVAEDEQPEFNIYELMRGVLKPDLNSFQYTAENRGIQGSVCFLLKEQCILLK